MLRDLHKIKQLIDGRAQIKIGVTYLTSQTSCFYKMSVILN